MPCLGGFPVPGTFGWSLCHARLDAGLDGPSLVRSNKTLWMFWTFCFSSWLLGPKAGQEEACCWSHQNKQGKLPHGLLRMRGTWQRRAGLPWPGQGESVGYSE